MPTLQVLRVFCAEDGTGGNPLGVFLDSTEVPAAQRQAIAHELGFAETVFVDDRERAEMRIFTPGIELPIAGHPLVGTAWLLREQGTDPGMLRPPAGECPVRFETEITFVAAHPEWMPGFKFVEFDSPADIDSLAGAPEGKGAVVAWSWADEEAGRIRDRVFFDDAGVAEDEATGSAAISLCARLGRPIEIRQGPTAGSLIYARPLDDGDGLVEIGGRVVLDEVQQYQRTDAD